MAVGLKAKVNKCDPLKNKTKALRACSDSCAKTVERWVLRKPEEKISITKLNHLTFHAIIKRDGGPFVSRSGSEGAKRVYDWVDDL